MFSLQQSRVPSSSFTTVHAQAAGSSSLIGAYPGQTGPRGISHVQSAPVVSQPRVQLQQADWLANQQRPQVQHWQSQPRLGQRWPNTAAPQRLWPASQTATAIRNTYRSDGFTGAQSSNTSTVMKGSRGGRSGQHVAVRPPVPTLGPRSAEKTRQIRMQLLDIFPDNAEQVDLVLRQNQYIYSVDELCLKVAAIA